MDSLRSLAKLLNDSIQQLDESYAKKGLVFPSLEEPSVSVDNEVYKDPIVKQATANIIASAAHITAIVQNPGEFVLGHSHQFHVPTALRMLVHGHVVEILKPHGRKGLHIDEIAKLANLNTNRLSAIARILRLLATEHVLTEVSPDVFAINRISSVIDSGKSVEEIRAKPDDKYVGSSGTAALVDHITNHGFKSSAYLSETLFDPETANSDESTDVAFNRAMGIGKTSFWEWLELPENKHHLRLFGMAMQGASQLLPADAILRGYDFSAVPAGSIVVDVGGGVGSQTLLVARAHPHLKYVVQDRPGVAAEMEQFWKAKYSEALDKGDVTFQGIDFFAEQPVTNASVFFMRMVLHDWSDARCIEILKRLRAAAQPNTRLLIIDMLLSYAVSSGTPTNDSADTVIPPAPLLNNGGHAGVLPLYSDAMMMIGMNARERTKGQFETLFAASGWKIEKIYQPPYYVISHSQLVLAPV